MTRNNFLLAGDIPGASVQQAAGVQSFVQQHNNQSGLISSQMLANLTNQEGKNEPVVLNPLVSAGAGLPALPKKMVERKLANDYIDFSELPPAKGKVRSLPSGLEGQVVLVQAADLSQSKKLIPDLATWVQCFALYLAVLAPQQPSRIPDLMAYMSCIAKASQKYNWPSWLVYDQKLSPGSSKQSPSTLGPGGPQHLRSIIYRTGDSYRQLVLKMSLLRSHISALPLDSPQESVHS